MQDGMARYHPAMRILLIPVLCLPLLTTGCFVGDGVAHVVKLAGKSYGSSNDDVPAPASQPAPAAAAAPAPEDPSPAPMPAAAPRDTIRVEELPPPAR